MSLGIRHQFIYYLLAVGNSYDVCKLGFLIYKTETSNSIVLKRKYAH